MSPFAALNPALPILALAAAAGPALVEAGRAARRRLAGGRWASGDRAPYPGEPLRPWREIGIPWAILGIAGLALLAPALALPSGIPSPAGTLSLLPPWGGAGEAPLPQAGAAAVTAPRAAVATAPAARSAAGAAPAEGFTGNPLLRDVTYQIQPWLLFLRRELRAGRLPGWNPHQFAGAPFWANGQSAALFPLHLLFAALPLVLGFCVLPWLRVVIGGCGVWVLARQLGLGMQAAALAALSFALSGMLVSFALFPMGNALALVPWVLWAVERLAAASDGPLPDRLRAGALLAVTAGLQLLAGHPETASHTALLSLVYLAVRGAARPFAAWAVWCCGWLAGAALAAVQLLPLAWLLPATTRWLSSGGGAEPPFGLLLQQPLRLVLPELYGHPARGTWWGPFNYSATAVYAGALALPLAAAGLARCRRDRRWLALAVAGAFAFAAAYHWPLLRDLLGALPVAGRAAHHRLIFGVELVLALLAGAGCDEWLAGRGRGILAGSALTLGLLAAAWALYRAPWAARALTAREAAWTAGVAGAAILAALSLRLPAAWRHAVAAALPALVACDLLLAHGAINPPLPLESLYPRTGAVRFLEAKAAAGRVAGMGETLRPDTATVYGLYDLRGDDPVKLARFEAVYGQLAPTDAVYFQPVARWDSPWLDRLGVRWVVAGPDQPPAAPGWRLAYAGSDARVYERAGALPLVRWLRCPRCLPDAAGGPAAARPALGSPAAARRPGGAPPEAQSAKGLEIGHGLETRGESATGEGLQTDEGLQTLERQPGLWRIAWHSAVPKTVVVAETWDRGWHAYVAGAPVPVEQVGGLLLGVPVAAGAGQIELRYRPAGLRAGAALSLGTLIAMLALAVWLPRAGRTGGNAIGGGGTIDGGSAVAGGSAVDGGGAIGGEAGVRHPRARYPEERHPGARYR